MKKALNFLVIVILIFIKPATVLADEPVPSAYDNYPYYNYILIDDHTRLSSVEIWGHDVDGNYAQITQSFNEYESKIPNEKIYYFYNSYGKFKDFQIVATLKNGEKVYSNFIGFGFYSKRFFKIGLGDEVDFSSYIYSVNDNTLITGNITTWKPDLTIIIPVSILLLLTLILSVTSKWLTSFAFRLKKSTPVIIINCITNTVVSMLLILIFVNFIFSYYLALIILLKALSAGVEFWFYTVKINYYSKKRLLLFSIVSNAASFGIYWLFALLAGL